jgi:hypothetical protein
MAIPTKKIVTLTFDAALPGAQKLLDAMAKKFVDPTGAPFFQFTIAEGGLYATGEAWSQKASVRPAHGTMQVYAEGYVQCLLDG